MPPYDVIIVLLIFIDPEMMFVITKKDTREGHNIDLCVFTSCDTNMMILTCRKKDSAGKRGKRRFMVTIQKQENDLDSFKKPTMNGTCYL